ncbi:MAG: 3-deoxy-D-manno-octulosonic acid transferase [Bacteroidales bacterium]|nr:3-deoxy-D-manno-octulosonic acid transferase [Bacteroidales bacterium]
MHLLYNTGIRFYVFIIHIAAQFNPKAKQWVLGRKNWEQRLQQEFKPNGPVVWFHCASLGEFEQGRPVMELYKAKHPDHFLLVTFFSPSGYEIRKDYELADYTCYLPADTPSNARKFIKLINPKLVFFIKYEFWFNYIHEIRTHHLPLYFISGIFRKNQHFFKSWGSWYRNQLQNITHFFVQNNESVQLLHSIGVENVSMSGDTRFDRVEKLEQNQKTFPLIEKFIADNKIIIVGSSWENEETFIAQLIKKNIPGYKFIIAPHEVHEEKIQRLLKKLPVQAMRYSLADEQKIQDFKVLIIDSIGLLGFLYKYSHIAIIGGGFNDGLHNTLEALTYGVPVIFGPKYHHFPEAFELIENGAGFSITDQDSFFQAINPLMENEEFHQKASKTAYDYIRSKTGVARKILEEIQAKQ